MASTSSEELPGVCAASATAAVMKSVVIRRLCITFDVTLLDIMTPWRTGASANRLLCNAQARYNVLSTIRRRSGDALSLLRPTATFSVAALRIPETASVPAPYIISEPVVNGDRRDVTLRPR